MTELILSFSLSYTPLHGGQRAEGIVAREMKRLRWQEKDLKVQLKCDPRKVRIASCLRKESTVTLKWIAQRLHMGTWTYLSNRLYRVLMWNFFMM